MKKKETLFDRKNNAIPSNAPAPLADRMRPARLADFVGQDHVLSADKLLPRLIFNDELSSLIFWGPPGVGKTTLAKIIAQLTKAHFICYSAVQVGTKEVKEEIAQAEQRWLLTKRRTILFLDEIHRFNKAQQDVLLPHVESGRLILIGATTENPSFSVIPALLSRCRVIVLHRLGELDLKKLIKRVLVDKAQGLGRQKLKIASAATDFLIDLSQGDARALYTILEIAARGKKNGSTIAVADISNAAMSRSMIYDKNGEEHYNVISALHKSLRDSDQDAALYWMARMIEAGEDPLYVVRRLLRFASEDIGNADPQALILAVSVMETIKFVGMPESNAALAQLVIYLAKAPKDNTAYVAYGLASADAKKTSNEPVPIHLRNAPTKLMKELGYGQGYKYAHNFKDAKVDQEHFPGKLRGRKYIKKT